MYDIFALLCRSFANLCIRGMFTGATIVIIGTCIQATAMASRQFLAGRFVLGFGVSFCCVSAPCYVSEMAHPEWRGTLTGFYNCTW